MSTHIERVNAALEELRQGKMIILTDHPDRENEGDLIAVAEKVTPEIMNFMIRQGTGIVCVSLTTKRAQELDFPLMVTPGINNCARGTQFTVSVDAKNDIKTGVSAADRSKTVELIVNDQAKPHDFVKPGHLFPLLAREGGVLEREGHTEGSIDLARLAGFKPAAVLCEIMNPDGSMTCGPELEAFAAKHQLTMLSIDDIIAYRLQKENNIEETSSATIPLDKYGNFALTVIKEKITGQEHVMLVKENNTSQKAPLVRIHSSCFTGDLLGSERCDCHHQLHYSLERISQEGGILIYLNQEGRGIGLLNKIKAYALQEQGLDTVEANAELGLPIDARQYYIAANILRNQGIQHIRLLTNNPNKLNDMEKYGISRVEREAMPAFDNEHNRFYLETKNTKLKHDINF